jgi:hypothetical protein
MYTNLGIQVFCIAVAGGGLLEKMVVGKLQMVLEKAFEKNPLIQW